MPAITSHKAIKGSEKATPPGKRIGATDPAERVEVTLRIRARKSEKIAALIDKLDTTMPGKKVRRMTREEFRDQHGADPADIVKIEAFAQAHGLDVVEASLSRRSVVLSGTVAALTTAFKVKLENYLHEGETFRCRTGSVHIPANIASIVEGVFGLDNRPQTRPHFRTHGTIQPLAAGAKPFTPVEVAQLYNFPTNLDGTGQCIAIIELGGGFRTADLQAYFKSLKLATPAVSAVSVDGGHNSPGVDADGEVMLDIEVAGAVAPKASIAVYFAPNTDKGFLDAITTAIHDTLRKPSVISISWGGPERSWTAQSLKAFNQAFQAAGVLGVTITAAAGDHGSADEDPAGPRANVDFPASSPYVLACGGTRLEANAGAITSETVWNNNDGWATGGGVSEHYRLPVWQKAAKVPKSANPKGKIGRGVPDVSGDADSETGYKTRVNGKDTVIGGTSAVAPLWAGLIALLNQKRAQSVGYLNPFLYSKGAAVLRDITAGTNGAYTAGPGWDACTGLGSPDGQKLAASLA